MARILSPFIFLFVFVWSAVAFAADYSPSFQTMEGELRDEQLVLAYELSPKSWKRLEELGIKPRLNVYEVRGGKDAFLDDQTLVSRKGSFQFSKKKVKLEEGDQVKIRIHGSSGDNRLTAWHLGGVSGKKIAFRIDEGKLVLDDGKQASAGSAPAADSRPTAPKGWRTEVVKACDRYAYVASEKGECVELAVKIDPRWAAETVEACSDSAYVKSEINACLKAASQHERHNPAETARACEENTYVPRDFLQCMQVTADYKAPPAKMLAACGEAVYVEREKMECFELAADMDLSSASLLQACHGRDWKQCVKAATDR